MMHIHAVAGALILTKRAWFSLKIGPASVHEYWSLPIRLGATIWSLSVWIGHGIWLRMELSAGTSSLELSDAALQTRKGICVDSILDFLDCGAVRSKLVCWLPLRTPTRRLRIEPCVSLCLSFVAHDTITLNRLISTARVLRIHPVVIITPTRRASRRCFRPANLPRGYTR
jgi:hypothetical protein